MQLLVTLLPRTKRGRVIDARIGPRAWLQAVRVASHEYFVGLAEKGLHPSRRMSARCNGAPERAAHVGHKRAAAKKISRSHFGVTLVSGACRSRNTVSRQGSTSHASPPPALARSMYTTPRGQ